VRFLGWFWDKLTAKNESGNPERQTSITNSHTGLARVGFGICLPSDEGGGAQATSGSKKWLPTRSTFAAGGSLDRPLIRRFRAGVLFLHFRSGASDAQTQGFNASGFCTRARVRVS
jgi:hypothetical protein